MTAQLAVAPLPATLIVHMRSSYKGVQILNRGVASEVLILWAVSSGGGYRVMLVVVW